MDVRRIELTVVRPRTTPAPARWRVAAAVAVVGIVVSAMVMTRRATDNSIPIENPLANAQYTRLTGLAGTEGGAEISRTDSLLRSSPIAKVSCIWLSQVALDISGMLTKPDFPACSHRPTFGNWFLRRRYGNLVQSRYRSGDGAVDHAADAGGNRAPFSTGRANATFVSRDGTRLTYFKNQDGDPMFVGDSTGADARQVLIDQGVHNHNPVWSVEGQWIYFARDLSRPIRWMSGGSAVR